LETEIARPRKSLTEEGPNQVKGGRGRAAPLHPEKQKKEERKREEELAFIGGEEQKLYSADPLNKKSSWGSEEDRSVFYLSTTSFSRRDKETRIAWGGKKKSTAFAPERLY